jgi:hypothetical protein
MRASDRITRIALLGGSWNGLGVDGFEYVLTDSKGAINSFQVFREGVEWLIQKYPYICYDTLRDHLVEVTNDSSRACEKYRCDDVKILQMVAPTLKELKRWYVEECEALGV